MADEGNPGAPDPGQGAPPPPPPPPAAPLHSQADLDRIVGREVAEAKRSATRALTAQLGFEKVEDLTKWAETAKTAELAAMTESDRLKAEIATEKAALASERSALQSERHNVALSAALQAAGATGDTARLARMVDVAAGSDPTAITAAVGALKADFPQLFGTPARPGIPSSEPSGGAPRSGASDTTTPFERGRAEAARRNAARNPAPIS